MKISIINPQSAWLSLWHPSSVTTHLYYFASSRATLFPTIMKSRTIHRKRLLRVVLWTLVLCFNCIVAEETGERQPDYFEATEANEYDDRTLLDTFGQAAKEFLTKRVIPDTDADCKWDWRYVRCGKKSSVNDGILNVLISNKKANSQLFWSMI